MLAMPCDINAQDKHGCTALIYAAMKGHQDTISALLEHKADPEIETAQRWTALMYATRGGHLEVVQQLLRAHADPNVHGDYDTFETPLTLAARYGHFPIVRALVGAGADVALHGGCAQLTAECIARHEGHHQISEFLLYYERKPSS